MPRIKRRLKVVYKLFKNVWGYGHVYPLQLDARLKGKKHLEILIHEALHYLYPLKSEEEVKKMSIILCNTLWDEGYRRIDNTNNILLQDGKK